MYEWRKGKICDKIDCRNPLLYSKEDYNNLEKVIKEEYLAEDKDILMLVAGEHVQKDIAGEKKSWKSELEKAGYQVVCSKKGLGEFGRIQEQFVKHIYRAMETKESVNLHKILKKF